MRNDEAEISSKSMLKMLWLKEKLKETYNKNPKTVVKVGVTAASAALIVGSMWFAKIYKES